MIDTWLVLLLVPAFHIGACAENLSTGAPWLASLRGVWMPRPR